MIMQFLIVGFGAFIGACLRHGVNLIIKHYFELEKLFYSTFIVNMLGSFFIGLMFSYLSNISGDRLELRLLIITGLLGSFTTFSTFSLENYQFLIDGEYLKFILYSVISLLIGLIMVYLGIKIYEQF